ncbi:MAG: hypothetical protein ABFR50_11525, partial [Candidatus Fermentibacteria bacterium]
GGEFDIRGFLSPGGEHDRVILTAQNKPLLRQGRKHAGAWFDAGRWARVETPEKGFIEAHTLTDGILFSEDFADKGSHLSIFNVHDRKRELEVLWLLGNSENDKELSRIYKLPLKPDPSH